MRSSDDVVSFAPGRANLIGEHTDYNDGLALPFAIEQGIHVIARPCASAEVLANAVDHGERERFPLSGLSPKERAGGWRDFVRGAIGELQRAGHELSGAELEITSDVPEGGGLSSSAALEVALCLALLAVAGSDELDDRVSLARLCSRIENEWVGARTGLLDQLASLCGRAGHALRIDFRTLSVNPVPLELGDWQLVTVPSGEQHSLAESGYNERREESERAREQLGLDSLRDARLGDLGNLPDPLDRRVRHVIEENARVEETITALHARDLEAVGRLLDASHASLRDLYDSSTDAVEETVERLKRDGAAGARMMGGGFGGHVLALLPPNLASPPDAHVVAPSAGARLSAPE
ncbi:MAG TPA: galactokinase family protein [Solirubrobacteraceae bacterium]|nr:galactokinase family protein [Solirubrobacteraceae bacterium]